MPTGTIGREVRIARRNPAFLNAPSFPFRERVPSGKTRIEAPFLSCFPIWSNASRAFSLFSRSTGMKPASHIDQPRNGIQKSCFFATKRTSRASATKRTTMSAAEVWFAMKIASGTVRAASDVSTLTSIPAPARNVRDHQRAQYW
jgi:hypothetical protein